MKAILLLPLFFAIIGCGQRETMPNEAVIREMLACCEGGMVPGYTIDGLHTTGVLRVICRPALDHSDLEKFRSACPEILKGAASKNPQASGACMEKPDTAGKPPKDAVASGPKGRNPTGPLP